MYSIDIARLFSTVRMRVLVFLFKIEPFPVSYKGHRLLLFYEVIEKFKEFDTCTVYFLALS